MILNEVNNILYSAAVFSPQENPSTKHSRSTRKQRKKSPQSTNEWKQGRNYFPFSYSQYYKLFQQNDKKDEWERIKMREMVNKKMNLNGFTRL